MRPSPLHPACAPDLVFTLADHQHAFDTLGANCGPGAIAGLCGLTSAQVALVMGERFQRLKGTKETMLREALTHFGVDWSDATYEELDYGIVRVQWVGPWLTSADPYEKYRHSHWIGICREGDAQPIVFDINAISKGGWISFQEWNAELIPWLLQKVEPLATGRWFINDVVRVHLNQTPPT